MTRERKATAAPLDLKDIELRPLATHEERAACVALQRETWGDDFSDVIPTAVLKVSQRVGGVALGAFDGDNALVGFVFGLTGVERGRIVHWSDMLAVVPRARNIGLGRRLKEEQRRIVRDLGGDVIYWTYDPLVARNAHLNFNRLGVGVAEYAETMYGITDSVLHGGVPTDRIIVAWPTDDAETSRRLAESERALESSDSRDAPVVTQAWIESAAGAAILPHTLRVEVPLDGEALLLGRSPDALKWRTSVRTGMQWAFANNYTVSAFYQDDAANRGFYLMTKTPRSLAGNGGGPARS